MPNSLNVTSSYRGTQASAFIALSILRGKMIEKGLMQKFPLIKKEMHIPVMKLDGIVKPYTTDFEASGSVEVSERILDPKARGVHLEFPIDYLEQLFLSEQMPAGMHNSEMPDSFEEFLVMYIQAAVSNEVDNLIWNSDTGAGTATLAQADGLLKLMTIDPDVVDVAINTLTVDNIIDEMGKVYLAAPEGVSETDSGFFMSVGAKRLYKMALAKTGLLTANTAVNGDLLYDEKIRVETIPKFAANTFVLTPTVNLAFGTDLESDMNEVRIVDMRFTTNDNKIRLRMDFKLDANYGFGEEVVLAKTA